MTVSTESNAYALYTRHGVVGGTSLTRAQFNELWRHLSDDDRQYWTTQFEKGATELSKEFIAKVDVVKFSAKDSALIKRVAKS